MRVGKKKMYKHFLVFSLIFAFFVKYWIVLPLFVVFEQRRMILMKPSEAFRGQEMSLVKLL